MAFLRHPNCVAFLGACAEPPCLITELASQGSLADVLRKAASGSQREAAALTWPRRLQMVRPREGQPPPLLLLLLHAGALLWLAWGMAHTPWGRVY